MSVLAGRLNRAPRPSEIAAYLELSVDQVMDALHAGEAHSSTSMDQPAAAKLRGHLEKE